MRYRLVSEGLLPPDFKRVEMVNWTPLLGLEQGVKVRYTSSSWIVHVEALYGRHLGELFNLARNLADRVARLLMQKLASLSDYVFLVWFFKVFYDFYGMSGHVYPFEWYIV